MVPDIKPGPGTGKACKATNSLVFSHFSNHNSYKCLEYNIFKIDEIMQRTKSMAVTGGKKKKKKKYSELAWDIALNERHGTNTVKNGKHLGTKLNTF